MPISRSQLAPGEEVIIDVRPHWQVLVGPAIVPTVVVGGATAIMVAAHPSSQPIKLALGLVCLAVVVRFAVEVLRWARTSTIVTTERLFLQSGVLARTITEVRLQRIIEVTCSQRMVDRLVGTGRLTIGLLDGEPLELGDVRRPSGIQKILYRQIRALEANAHLMPTNQGRLDDDRSPNSDHIERVPMLGAFDDALMEDSREIVPPPLPSARPYDDDVFADRDDDEVVAPFDPTPPNGTKAVTATSSAVRLEELAELYRKGLISESEYGHLRADVLARYKAEG